jgi:hypothetical protein
VRDEYRTLEAQRYDVYVAVEHVAEAAAYADSETDHQPA